jgi:hypothetical protein
MLMHTIDEMSYLREKKKLSSCYDIVRDDHDDDDDDNDDDDDDDDDG